MRHLLEAFVRHWPRVLLHARGLGGVCAGAARLQRSSSGNVGSQACSEGRRDSGSWQHRKCSRGSARCERCSHSAQSTAVLFLQRRLTTGPARLMRLSALSSGSLPAALPPPGARLCRALSCPGARAPSVLRRSMTAGARGAWAKCGGSCRRGPGWAAASRGSAAGGGRGAAAGGRCCAAGRGRWHQQQLWQRTERAVEAARAANS